MTEARSGDTVPRLQKVVEAIAITPEAAHDFVNGYRRRFEERTGHRRMTAADKLQIAKKIIRRYAALAATSGAVTALPGAFPGIGTIVATLGGGATDVAVTVKIQIDMCMCLVDLYQDEDDLSDEDKKHLAFILALASTTEQFATITGKKVTEEAVKRMVYRYLSGPALVTIKQLFKRVGIIFTQKAAVKWIPLGVGVGLSSAANYALTTFVGRVAVGFLQKGSGKD